MNKHGIHFCCKLCVGIPAVRDVTPRFDCQKEVSAEDGVPHSLVGVDDVNEFADKGHLPPAGTMMVDPEQSCEIKGRSCFVCLHHPEIERPVGSRHEAQAEEARKDPLKRGVRAYIRDGELRTKPVVTVQMARCNLSCAIGHG